MLRAAAVSSLRRGVSRTTKATLFGRSTTSIQHVSSPSWMRLSNDTPSIRSALLHGPPTHSSRTSIWRTLSSSSSKNENSETKKTSDNDHETSNEIVLTPGEKVVAGTRLTMWFGIAVFAGFCAYYIGKELIPTKMSPNKVFDRALALVRNDPEVKRRFGDSLKGYGRDHGGHREGRRNFIEHTEYTDKEDGSKRTRVRFNLEGRFGKAFVFAEVSSEMPSGEFVYVLVQDKANGRVTTVVDNRSALTAARLSGGSKEGQDALANLLKGGGNK